MAFKHTETGKKAHSSDHMTRIKNMYAIRTSHTPSTHLGKRKCRRQGEESQRRSSLKLMAALCVGGVVTAQGVTRMHEHAEDNKGSTWKIGPRYIDHGVSSFIPCDSEILLPKLQVV